MEIENKKATNITKILLIRVPLLVVLIVLVLTMMEVIPSAIWLIISAGVFLVTLLSVLLGRMHYVYFSFSEREIVMRHFHLFPLIRDFQEFSVQISDNPEFEIRYWFFKLVPVLYVQISTSQGRAVYPPIPLSLLSKDDRTELQKQLGIQ